jgi:hypothetical protein
LEQNGDETLMSERAETDALGGWPKEMGRFRVRALLAAPVERRPWLLVEVYAEAADADYRIISSQKVSAPFATGRMEVVEPRLGGSPPLPVREGKMRGSPDPSRLGGPDGGHSVGG